MLRQDLFTLIHKAIRSMIYDLGIKLLQADFSDVKASKEITSRLEHDMEMLSEHGGDEEQFIFPELQVHEAALVDLFLKEHHIIEERIRKVRSIIEKLEFVKNSDSRVDMGENLNRAFNDLASTYLTHMHHEETILLPTTWEHFTDEKLGYMRANIQRNTSPDRYAEWLHLVFGATNNSELILLFKGVKNSAPAPVLENMKRIAEKSLGIEKWNEIKQAAGL